VHLGTHDLITFFGQKVKVQGHTIAAEAHSTRRYRRVQLFSSLFTTAIPIDSQEQNILDRRRKFELSDCFLMTITRAPKLILIRLEG